MKILSYHRFTHSSDPYPFSRTYPQFKNDINREFDLITMDDGWISQIRACEILRDKGIKPILAITTDFIEKEGYIDWEDLDYLYQFCEIANHSHSHPHLLELDECKVRWQIRKANKLLKKYQIKYFIPPYNQTNEAIDLIAKEEGLSVLPDRITILNTTHEI
jgi:peptidoglycan/xylan/chitin deacetylase (PgdA/CDA1 family)